MPFEPSRVERLRSGANDVAPNTRNAEPFALPVLKASSSPPMMKSARPSPFTSPAAATDVPTVPLYSKPEILKPLLPFSAEASSTGTNGPECPNTT